LREDFQLEKQENETKRQVNSNANLSKFHTCRADAKRKESDPRANLLTGLNQKQENPINHKKIKQPKLQHNKTQNPKENEYALVP